MQKTTIQGNNLNITDMSNLPMTISPIGNDEQDTREGYNLIDILNSTLINTNKSVEIEIDKDGYVIANGTPTADYIVFIRKSIDNLLEDKQAYSLWQEKYSSIQTGAIYSQVLATPKEGSSVSLQYIVSGNQKVNFTVDKTNYTYSWAIQTSSISNAGTFNNYRNRYMLYKGTGNKEFELYGASPSLDYPSPIKCLGSNINLVTEVLNNLWYNSDTNKFMTIQNTVSAIAEIPQNTNITIKKKNGGNRFAVMTSYTKPQLDVDLTTIFIDNENPNRKTYTFKNTDKKWVWVGVQNGGTEEDKQKAIEEIKIEEGEIATSYSPYGQGSTKIEKTNRNYLDSFNYYTANTIKTINGITFKINEDGTITANGTATANAFFDFSYTHVIGTNKIMVLNNISGSSTGGNVRFVTYNSDFSAVQNITIDGRDVQVVNLNADIEYSIFRYAVHQNVVCNNLTLGFMVLDKTETDRTYTQHQGENYILNIQQEMLEGDYFDLETKEEVHCNGKVILNGTEAWTKSETASTEDFPIFYTNRGNIVSSGEVKSNALKYVKDYQTQDTYVTSVGEAINIRIATEIIGGNTVELFKTFLQNRYNKGKAIEVYYKRSTPARIPLTEEQIKVLYNLTGSKPYSPITKIIVTPDIGLVNVEYYSIDEQSDGTMNPTWVEENGKKIFPITHNRAILGGLSYKAYNIDDAVYGNNWNNVTDNGFYYDNNGYNRPPVGINTYPNKLLVEVFRTKNSCVMQRLVTDNTELFGNTDRNYAGEIKDKYSRIGVESSDGNVTWGEWHVNNPESLTSRTYVENTGSTATVRTITINGITSLDQVKDKVIFIKSLTSGSASATTLNINSLGAKQIRINRNSALSTSLIPNWVRKDQVYSVSYDGTYFNILSGGDTSENCLPLGGGTMSGTINSSKTTGTYLAGSQGTAVINSTASSGAYTTLLKGNSNNGKFTLNIYQSSMIMGYMSNDAIEAGTNSLTKSWYFAEDGSFRPGINNSQNLGTSGAKWANVYATTFTGNLSGNASSATKLQTARTINGVAFDGTKNIIIDAGGSGHTILNSSGTAMTQRSKLRFNNATVTDDAGNDVTIITPTGTTGNYLPLSGGKLTGNVTPTTNNTLSLGTSALKFSTMYATTFYGALSGNASTATTLANARTINGTSFNGSANITTTNWGTARNIGIVNSDGTGTAVVTSVNGSANVNLKLPSDVKAMTLSQQNIRDIKPNEISTVGISGYFATKEGMTGSAGTDYQDLIVLNGWNDTSGGNLNAISFDKSTKVIYHYQAAKGATTWGTPNQIAYTNSTVAVATKATVTETSPTTYSTYNLVFASNTSTGNADLRINNIDLKIGISEGTASVGGYEDLYLGNNIATGTAGNKRGRIMIYSNNTGYDAIQSGTAHSGIYTHYLPDHSGLLVDSSNSSVTNIVSLTKAQYDSQKDSLPNGTIVNITDSNEAYVTTQSSSITCDLPLDL